MSNNTHIELQLEQFRKRLREIREKAGYSQEGLANSMGWTQSQVGRAERGEAYPTIESVFRLANALNVDISQFFLSTGQPIIFKEVARRK